MAIVYKPGKSPGNNEPYTISQRVLQCTARELELSQKGQSMLPHCHKKLGQSMLPQKPNSCSADQASHCELSNQTVSVLLHACHYRTQTRYMHAAIVHHMGMLHVSHATRPVSMRLACPSSVPRFRSLLLGVEAPDGSPLVPL